mgnify:CR=1 FL=1
MVDCDNCKSEVGHVWNYRRPTETMTYWREQHLCADCHPRMRDGRRSGA